MKHIPLLALISSVIIFWYASTLYPGGTRLDPTTTGYSWTENTISALFQPIAVNGDVNPARWFAVFAVFLFTAASALLFHRIASFMSGMNQQAMGEGSGGAPGQTPGRGLVRAVRVGGLGAMISAFLVVTPLHDIKVTLALLFFIVAVIALLRWLHAMRLSGLFYLGLTAFSLPLLNAVLFYGQFGHEWLPIVQKLGKFACIFWLFGCYYILGNRLQHKATGMQSA